jgi:hypothetical protein
MLDADGVLDLSHNWTKPGWVDSFGGSPTTIHDDGTQLEGDAPGFVDEAAQDFSLLGDSDAVDAGGALHPDVLPDHAVAAQYVRHQTSGPRPLDAAPDLGAFEVSEPASALGAAIALAAAAALGRAARRRRERGAGAGAQAESAAGLLE